MARKSQQAIGSIPALCSLIWGSRGLVLDGQARTLYIKSAGQVYYPDYDEAELRILRDDGLLVDLLLEGPFTGIDLDYSLRVQAGKRLDELRLQIILRNARKQPQARRYSQFGYQLPLTGQALTTTIRPSVKTSGEAIAEGQATLSGRVIQQGYNSYAYNWKIINILGCMGGWRLQPVAGECDSSRYRVNDSEYGVFVDGVQRDRSYIAGSVLVSEKGGQRQTAIGYRDLPAHTSASILLDADNRLHILPINSRTGEVMIAAQGHELAEVVVDLDVTNEAHAMHYAQRPVYGVPTRDQLSASGAHYGLRFHKTGAVLDWWERAEYPDKPATFSAYVRGANCDYRIQRLISNRRNYFEYTDYLAFASVDANGCYLNSGRQYFETFMRSAVPRSDGYDYRNEGDFDLRSINPISETDITHAETGGIYRWGLWSGGDWRAMANAHDLVEFMARSEAAFKHSIFSGSRQHFQRLKDQAEAYYLFRDKRILRTVIELINKRYAGAKTPIDVDTFTDKAPWTAMGYYRDRCIYLSDSSGRQTRNLYLFNFSWSYGGQTYYALRQAMRNNPDPDIYFAWQRYEQMMTGLGLSSIAQTVQLWGDQVYPSYVRNGTADHRDVRVGRFSYLPIAYVMLLLEHGIDYTPWMKGHFYTRLRNYNLFPSATDQPALDYIDYRMSGRVIPQWEPVAFSRDDDVIAFSTDDGYHYRVLAANREIVKHNAFNALERTYQYPTETHVGRCGAQIIEHADGQAQVGGYQHVQVERIAQ